MAAFPPPQPFPRHCSIPITKFHNYANCSNNNNNTRPSNSCFTSFCFRGEIKIEFAKPTTLASVPVRVSASYANWMLTCVSPTHTYRETLSHTHSHTRSHYSAQRDEEQLWCALSARTNTNNSWAAAYNSNNNNKQYNNRANNETCQRPDDDDDEEAR